MFRVDDEQNIKNVSSRIPNNFWMVKYETLVVKNPLIYNYVFMDNIADNIYERLDILEKIKINKCNEKEIDLLILLFPCEFHIIQKSLVLNNLNIDFNYYKNEHFINFAYAKNLILDMVLKIPIEEATIIICRHLAEEKNFFENKIKLQIEENRKNLLSLLTLNEFEKGNSFSLSSAIDAINSIYLIINSKNDLNKKSLESEINIINENSLRNDKTNILLVTNTLRKLVELKDERIYLCNKKLLSLEKNYEIIKNLSKNNTLKEVGIIYDVTRERVRQVEKKGLIKIEEYLKKIEINDLKSSFEFLSEYNVDNKVCDILGINKLTYTLISSLYELKTGHRDFKNLYYDFNLKGTKLGDKFLKDNNLIDTGNELIFLTKSRMTKAFDFWFSNNCVGYMSIEEIENEFYNFIVQFDIEIKKSSRQIEGYLFRSNFSVYNNELGWKLLNNNHVENLCKKIFYEEEDELPKFFSSLLLFNKHKEVLCDANITHHSELYYILKKIDSKKTISYGIEFIRVPHIAYDNIRLPSMLKYFCDNNKQIKRSSVVKELSLATGVRMESIAANMDAMNMLDSLYSGENYLINILDSNIINKLKNVMTENIYSINRVNILLNQFNVQNNVVIKLDNLSQVGFRVKNNYIIKREFSGLLDYLDHMTDENSILFTDDFMKECSNYQWFKANMQSYFFRLYFLPIAKGVYFNCRKSKIKNNIENVVVVSDSIVKEKKYISATKIMEHKLFINAINENGLYDYGFDLNFWTEVFYSASNTRKNRKVFYYYKLDFDDIYEFVFTQIDGDNISFEHYQKKFYEIIGAKPSKNLEKKIEETSLYYDSFSNFISSSKQSFEKFRMKNT